jgi:hypothetical protein
MDYPGIKMPAQTYPIPELFVPDQKPTHFEYGAFSHPISIHTLPAITVNSLVVQASKIWVASNHTHTQIIPIHPRSNTRQSPTSMRANDTKHNTKPPLQTTPRDKSEDGPEKGHLKSIAKTRGWRKQIILHINNKD